MKYKNLIFGHFLQGNSYSEDNNFHTIAQCTCIRKSKGCIQKLGRCTFERGCLRYTVYRNKLRALRSKAHPLFSSTPPPFPCTNHSYRPDFSLLTIRSCAIHHYIDSQSKVVTVSTYLIIFTEIIFKNKLN